MDETPGRIEPLLLSEAPPSELADLATELVAASAKLPGRLPPAVVMELASLVRIVNCHHSNLIEGHDATPVEIERSLASSRPETRPLLREALAHLAVQRHLELAHAGGRLGVPTDASELRDVHRRLYEGMPEEYRTTTQGGRTVAIVPGAFRSRPDEDVAVGRHVPPSSARVADFMAAFERRLRTVRTPMASILAIPTAHHRFGYVHPFVDGNGRVGRLMSHAMALRAGVGSQGLWSLSRGLSRGLAHPGEYKALMAAADEPRRSSRDGRGNLSEAALVTFSAWFLKVALDQIGFCASVFDLAMMSSRYRDHLGTLFGDDRPGRLVSAVLETGDVGRQSASTILGTSEGTAGAIVASCLADGFLRSDAPNERMRVAFPVGHGSWLFPGLFDDGGVRFSTPARI
jgi:Fic family protein